MERKKIYIIYKYYIYAIEFDIVLFVKRGEGGNWREKEREREASTIANDDVYSLTPSHSLFPIDTHTKKLVLNMLLEQQQQKKKQFLLNA